MSTQLFALTLRKPDKVSRNNTGELEQEIAEAEALADQMNDPQCAADLRAYAEFLRQK